MPKKETSGWVSHAGGLNYQQPIRDRHCTVDRELAQRSNIVSPCSPTEYIFARVYFCPVIGT